MACYIVASMEILNPEQFQTYVEQSIPVVTAFGGKLLAGSQPDTMEGDWNPRRLAIVEFPNVEQAMAWWRSPEYSVVKKLRRHSAVARIVLVPGLPV